MAPNRLDDLVRAYAQRFPLPTLTCVQAAVIANVSPRTIHNWSSRGDLDAVRLSAKHESLRLHRDDFVRWFFGGKSSSLSARR